MQPRGVAVVIEAMHLCMIMRGVQKQHSVAVTSCMLGAFRDQQQTREEFLSLHPQAAHTGWASLPAWTPRRPARSVLLGKTLRGAEWKTLTIPRAAGRTDRSRDTPAPRG